jgi:hypothetical protein
VTESGCARRVPVNGSFVGRSAGASRLRATTDQRSERPAHAGNAAQGNQLAGVPVGERNRGLPVRRSRARSARYYSRPRCACGLEKWTPADRSKATPANHLSASLSAKRTAAFGPDEDLSNAVRSARRRDRARPPGPATKCRACQPVRSFSETGPELPSSWRTDARIVATCASDIDRQMRSKCWRV